MWACESSETRYENPCGADSASAGPPKENEMEPITRDRIVGGVGAPASVRSRRQGGSGWGFGPGHIPGWGIVSNLNSGRSAATRQALR